MTVLARGWRRFWFPPIPPQRIAVLRILLCGYLLWDVLFESRWILRYAHVAGDFYHPIFLIRALGLPRLGPEALGATWLVLAVALFCALIGLRTRRALLVAASLYLYWFATYHSYGWVWHFKVVPTLALFVLAIAPSGRFYSVDARRAGHRDQPDEVKDAIASWACQFLIVVLCSHYLMSALQKLRFSGLDWWTGGAFEQAIMELGSPFARDLAENHLWLVHGMALSVFAFEACALVLLFRTRLRMYYAGAAILFHVMTLALLGLSFLGWAAVCCVVFPLERLPGYLAAVWAPVRRRAAVTAPRPTR